MPELSLSGTDLINLLKDTLAKGAVFRFRVKGFSMLPFIGSGDVLTLSASAANFGDVVAFTHPETNKLFIHRIVSVQGDFFILKGDNVFKPDGLIRKDVILGRVTKIERNNKEILFGLGGERFLIAILSKTFQFFSFLLIARRASHSILRKFSYAWAFCKTN